MIIYLYGHDSYRRQKKLNQVVAEYQKKHSDISCAFFDLDSSEDALQEEFLRLKEFSSQQLLFDNKKMAVLKNIFEKTEVKKLKEFFKKYTDSKDFIILISENNSPPKELEFLLEKAFSAEKFENLEIKKWRFFIQKEAAARKLNLTPNAMDFLFQAYKNDTWGLINELEKLTLIFKNFPIGVEELKKIGDYKYKSPDIYNYINAVSRDWSLSQRIIALEKLFLVQEEPAKIFNFFASLNRLPQNLIKKLADYDVMVKSGKIDYDEILVDLALMKE